MFAKRVLVGALSLSLLLATIPIVAPQSAQAATKSTTIKISAAGDCTLGTDPKFSYSSSFNRQYAKKGPKFFLQKVQSVFAKDDISVVNLEGTLTRRGSARSKAFTFRGSPSYTRVLTNGSVEVASFANNHAYDYGNVSHADTIKYVNAAGVRIPSYARTSMKMVKGIGVGFVAVNDVENSGDVKKLIRAGISNLKKKKATIIVVSIHAGIEKAHKANARQRSLAHYAVDKGANLVLGHHPHVMQGVERYKGVYIAYSLGNFCFGGNSNPSDKDTMILQRTFTVTNGRVVQDKKLKLIPCSISSHTSYNDYQPRIVGGKRASKIISRVNSYSKGAGLRFYYSGWVR